MGAAVARLNLLEHPTPKSLLEFLVPLEMPSDMTAFRERYSAVSEKDRTLFLSLEEPELKENLFGPLRQAKTNFILGNYVGSIALCGIVAEKVAILVHALSSSSEHERNEFEGFDQSRELTN